MNNVLVEYTPFKPTIVESKTRPGVFEVTGVMQRAGAKIKMVECTTSRFFVEKLTTTWKTSLR